MASSEQEFRREVLDRILPYLESQCFHEWKPSVRDNVPAVYLERYRNGRRDLIDIQFDKYGRMAFFVNLASITGEAVETMFEGKMPSNEVTTAHLHEQCRLTRANGSHSFKPSFLSRLGGVAKAANQVASSFTRSFVDAQGWFEKGSVGRHVMTYRL